MAGWNIRELNGMDTAKFYAIIGSVTIEGFIRDCDGDYVFYEVRENGVTVASAEVHPTDKTQPYVECWHKAMNAANKVIISAKQKTPASKVKIDHNPKPKSFAQSSDDDNDSGFRKNHGYKGRKNPKKNRRPRDDRYGDY